jgi:hypothetical protein
MQITTEHTETDDERRQPKIACTRRTLSLRAINAARQSARYGQSRNALFQCVFSLAFRLRAVPALPFAVPAARARPTGWTGWPQAAHLAARFFVRRRTPPPHVTPNRRTTAAARGY